MDDDPRRSKYLLSLRRTSNDVLKMFPAGHTDIGSSPIGDTQRHKDKDTKKMQIMIVLFLLVVVIVRYKKGGLRPPFSN